MQETLFGNSEMFGERERAWLLEILFLGKVPGKMSFMGVRILDAR